MERTTRKKILVVDEDLLSNAMISQILLRGGYVISHATDHRTALKVIGNERPDLIICNLDGRNLDTHELVSTVQKAKESRAIPFLFLVASQRDQARAPDILGPKQYLAKPFTREQLTTAVQEHFGRKKQSMKRS